MNEELIVGMLKQVLTRIAELEQKIDRIIPAQQDTELLDNYDVYNLFHIGRTTLYRWRKEKKIPYISVRKKCYYKKSDLLQLFEKE